MMPVPRRSPHSISHPGPRRVSRIQGRTHVSTRPRAAPLLKISLAPKGASTHVAKFVSGWKTGRVGWVLELDCPRVAGVTSGPADPIPPPFFKLCDRPVEPAQP